jgi:hypothetical protein
MPVRRGIEFVGWKTWWNHRVPRRQTLSRMRERVRSFERRNVKRAFGGLGQCIELGRQGANSVQRLRESLASYSGHLRHGAACGAWNGVWVECAWLRLVFRRQGWAFVLRWPERQQSLRLRDRYAALLRGAGSDCLVFQRVGRYVEFYGPQRLLAERVLGLKCVWLPRAGYGFLVGFPVWLQGRFAEQALRSKVAVFSPASSGACYLLTPPQVGRSRV